MIAGDRAPMRSSETMRGPSDNSASAEQLDGFSRTVRGHRRSRQVNRLVRLGLWCIAIASVALLGLVDYVTGPEISLSIFYLIPTGFCAWYVGPAGAAIVAIGSALAWLLADLATNHAYTHPAIAYWNSLVRLGFFSVVVYLLTAFKRLKAGLEATVEERTAALNAEVLERSRIEHAVLEIGRQERQRIAHDLHDDLGQRLTCAALKAKMLEQDLAAAFPPQSAAAAEITRLLNEGTQHVRRLARGLDPVDVEANGLTAALERLTKETEKLCNVRCGFTYNQTKPQLNRSASLNLYRIAQEALNNAVRHGKARSINVELVVDPTDVWLRIADDGIGCDPEEKSAEGMGMRIMRYRAGVLGGVLTVRSGALHGTLVECRVPPSAVVVGPELSL